jgi:hypothetical protein
MCAMENALVEAGSAYGRAACRADGVFGQI